MNPLNERLQALAAAVGGDLLGLETSCALGSVCLVRRSGELFASSLPAQARPSEHVAAEIARGAQALGLRLGGLKGIVVGHGPGSFTGIRVGMATAQGLALGSGARLLGISSLETMALRVAQAQSPAAPCEVATVLDARGGDVYFGRFAYRPDGAGGLCPRIVVADRRQSVASLAPDLAPPAVSDAAQIPLFLVGDFVARLPPGAGQAVGELPEADAPCGAACALLLAAAALQAEAAPAQPLMPHYLRRSTPEERLEAQLTAARGAPTAV